MDDKRGINFSEQYLTDCFDTYYRTGIEAVEQGKNVYAKERLTKAAEYADKLAFVLKGEKKTEFAERAKRLRAIAEAIPVVQPTRDSAVRRNNTQTEKADENEIGQFLTFFTAEELDVGFDDIIGLDSAKAAVTEYVILPHRYPDAYNYKFLDGAAILLEGPPGTGKTTFAKAVAKEINQPFAIVNVATLVNCYVGETAKNIDKVFAYLRQYSQNNSCGITVFFDELDEIAKKRGSDDKTSEAAVPALLRNLDGMKGNKNFLILANTNRKDMLDAAISERFRKQLFIPLPDEAMRKQLFETKLKEVEPAFLSLLDLNSAAASSDGLSGRDITFICDDMKYLFSRMKAGLSEKDTLNERLQELIDERKKDKKIVNN